MSILNFYLRRSNFSDPCLAVNREYAPEIPKELTREALTEFSRIRPVMIPKTSSFAKSQLASVTARIAQFWSGVMEEERDCIVPMVQTGIGSALINENHVLAKEEAVEMTPIEFLASVPVAVFWSGNRKNEAVGFYFTIAILAENRYYSYK